MLSWPDQAEATRVWREAFAETLNNYALRNLEFAEAGFRRVLELLPEDGPADWVVAERERYRAGVVEAALAVTDLLAADDPAAALRACEQGLRADRYSDAQPHTGTRLK